MFPVVIINQLGKHYGRLYDWWGKWGFRAARGGCEGQPESTKIRKTHYLRWDLLWRRRVKKRL